MAKSQLENKTFASAKKPNCRVVAVIPAYNEDRLIGSVVLKARQFVSDVIIVDDGSYDETAKIAGSAGAIVFKHDKNMGKGVALNTGLQKARELDPAAVVVMDADGQHDPAEIPLVARIVLNCKNCNNSCGWNLKYFGPDSDYQLPTSLNNNQKADIVIGSRYLENNSEIPKHRIWGHWIFNWITKLSSGVGSTDSQSGFRAFSPKAINLLSFTSDGFSVESEMQVIAHEHGLEIAEVPITVEYHEKPKRNAFRHGLYVLGGLIRLIGQYRPLLFFGLPGVLLMLGGLGMGALVVDIFGRKSELAVGYAMISVLLSVVGAVSFSTGIILHSIRGLLIEMLRDYK